MECAFLGFPRLQHVDVSHCIQITDGGLAALSKLTELRTLSVACCYELTDASIKQLHGLHALHMDGCSQITDRAFAGIAARMNALNTLSAGGCFNLTDASLAELMRCPELRTLNVRACIELRGGFEHATCSRTLLTLDMSSCVQLQDASVLNALRTLTSLRSLSLSNCHRLSGIVLDAVAQMPSDACLVELDLRGCVRIARDGSRIARTVRALKPKLRLLTSDLPPGSLHSVHCRRCTASALALLSFGAAVLFSRGELPVRWWHCSLGMLIIGGAFAYVVAAVFFMALAGGL
jgi:hypothetical protein